MADAPILDGAKVGYRYPFYRWLHQKQITKGRMCRFGEVFQLIERRTRLFVLPLIELRESPRERFGIDARTLARPTQHCRSNFHTQGCCSGHSGCADLCLAIWLRLPYSPNRLPNREAASNSHNREADRRAGPNSLPCPPACSCRSTASWRGVWRRRLRFRGCRCRGGWL